MASDTFPPEPNAGPTERAGEPGEARCGCGTRALECDSACSPARAAGDGPSLQREAGAAQAKSSCSRERAGAGRGGSVGSPELHEVLVDDVWIGDLRDQPVADRRSSDA